MTSHASQIRDTVCRWQHRALLILHIFWRIKIISWKCDSWGRSPHTWTRRTRQRYGVSERYRLKLLQMVIGRKPEGLVHPLPRSKAPVPITEKRKRPGGPTH